jgi:5-methylcytosine-specific restriction endonuclease McrA
MARIKRRQPKRYNAFKKDYCEACLSTDRLSVDHVKTLGSGGKDVPTNLMTLCFSCHHIKGSQGISYMVKNYPRYKEWLVKNNWYFCELMKRWASDFAS